MPKTPAACTKSLRDFLERLLCINISVASACCQQVLCQAGNNQSSNSSWQTQKANNMAATMDKQTLEYIMRGITSRDRALQRHIADTYLAEDVKFTHMLGDVQGREALYGVYRAAVTGIDYQLRVIDITLEQDESGGKAACWVDLNIKIAPFYIKRYHAPTIVMLRWRRCEDGLCRLTEQIDHHSLFVFMWVFGWPLSAFYDMVSRRVTGRLMSLSGFGVDAIEDAASAALHLYTHTLGWGLQQTLPEPVLASMAQMLPAGWSNRLGWREFAAQQPLAQQQNGYGGVHSQQVAQSPASGTATLAQTVAVGQQ